MPVEWNHNVDRHDELKRRLPDILDGEGWVKTGDVADKLQQSFVAEWGWGEQYTRAILGDMRSTLEDIPGVETEERLRGGMPTIFWRSTQ